MVEKEEALQQILSFLWTNIDIVVRASGSSSRGGPLVLRLVFTWRIHIEENALAAALARIRTGQIPGELSSFRTWGKKGREMKCRARNTACHSCVAVRVPRKSDRRLSTKPFLLWRLRCARARLRWREMSPLTWKKSLQLIPLTRKIRRQC